MTTTVMDSYLQQLYQPKDFDVTPEKLEELKEKVPKAGPKFRLGMYFETIHDLPEFDDVAVPDDGYTSHWETDTDLDSNFDNLLFSNVTGDSASVICLDEAMDLLALREEKKQHHYLDQGDQGGSLDDDIDNPFEQSTENKHSPASRNSHHSGSDGTYDGPAQPVAGISMKPDSAQDHTYETLDDCREEYQARVEGLYATKASDGSRGSDTVITKTAGNWSGGSDHSGQGSRVVRSHSQRLPNKPRSFSLPQPPAEMMCLHDHQRKFSDSSHFAHTKRKHTEQVAPKLVPLPPRGYAVPSGVPSDYAEYMTTPSLPPTPEKRLTHIRGGTSRKARPPSLVIKHKGQTFVIPVVDDKKTKTNTTAKARASQAPEGTAKHAAAPATLPRPSTSVHGSLHPNTAPVSRRHTSPPKAEACEVSASLHRRKSRQPSQSSVSPSQSKQVTHYGVL